MRPVSRLPAVLAVKSFGLTGSSVSGAGGISSSFSAIDTTGMCQLELHQVNCMI